MIILLLLYDHSVCLFVIKVITIIVVIFMIMPFINLMYLSGN
jgi:hypothetical protein